MSVPFRGMGTDTLYLSGTSDFLTGMASAVSLGGNFHEFSEAASPAEADAKAIGHDWSVVGQEIKDALKATSTVRI
jgi:hypothetical protein